MTSAAALNVIVVDDQQTIRSLVRSGLNQMGINHVREFATAKEAYDFIRHHAPHLIISDFNMPEIDGLEFLRVVRADANLKTVGFILLTGRADRDLVQRAAQFGANNYLVKPFTVANLKQKIEQVVGALT
jgi:two-component system, chemotaxis family, chemotaxis protein CheY